MRCEHVRQGPCWYFDRGWRACPALGIGIKVGLGPGREIGLLQHWRVAGRHVLGEALVLLLVGDQVPDAVLGLMMLVPPQNRPEQHERADRVRMLLGIDRGGHRSPTVRNDCDPGGPRFAANELDRPGDLFLGHGCPADWPACPRAAHLGITLGSSIPRKVETEDIEAPRVQRIRPGGPSKPEHDRKR